MLNPFSGTLRWVLPENKPLNPSGPYQKWSSVILYPFYSPLFPRFLLYIRIQYIAKQTSISVLKMWDSLYLFQEKDLTGSTSAETTYFQALIEFNPGELQCRG